MKFDDDETAPPDVRTRRAFIDDVSARRRARATASESLSECAEAVGEPRNWRQSFARNLSLALRGLL